MIGKVLGNRYEILEKIGGGGMAEVYRAKCNLLNRYVAVKILRDQFINDEEVMIKFKREAQAAASLSHPNIVNIYDVGVDGDINYIVMELIEGKTLKELIVENKKLNSSEVIRISISIAEALAVAHKNGIIHRDIKPHNIMLTPDNRVKVTDFGIARAATSSTISNTGSIVGSAHYLSPEQARGGYVDKKSDIYSLGVVMYEMTTGVLPFTGDSPITVAIKQIQEEAKRPSEIDPSISSNLEHIIMKCMMKDQGLRYQTTGELLNDLRAVELEINEDVKSIDDTTDFSTQILPAISDDIIEENMKAEDKEKDEIDKEPKKTKKKKKSKTKVLAIFLSFILVSGIALGYIAKQTGLFGDGTQVEGSQVKAPNLVGMKEKEAKEAVEDLGLKLKVKGFDENSKYPSGQVSRQDVKVGEEISKGTTIEVYISKSGISETEKVLPNVIGKTLEEAEAMLIKSEFKLGVVRYESSSETKGVVISQTPSANTSVEKGSKVDLVISKGDEEVSVPKLTGLTQSEAETELESVGLKLGKVTEKSSESKKGTVISQGTASGSKVEEGFSVNIEISKGNEENNDGYTDTENDGTVVRKSVIKIKLPRDREFVDVVVNKYENGVKEQVYSSKVNTAQQTITVEVEIRSKDLVKLEGLVDGVVTETREV